MARARDSPTRARKARERTSTRGRKKESTKMLEQKVRPKEKVLLQASAISAANGDSENEKVAPKAQVLHGASRWTSTTWCT